MFSVGQIVFSKQGRDKGKPFVVVAVEGDYVYLADGVLRRVEKPKKKKTMHVQITKDVCLEVKEKLINNQRVEDADLKKALMKFRFESERQLAAQPIFPEGKISENLMH